MIGEWFLDLTKFFQLSFCAHGLIMNYVTELFPLEFLSQEKTTECVIHSKCMTIKHKIVHGLGPDPIQI